jgi:aspartyl-tRNA(Asn)/glutamyl-tRNA(Gln) amidotransferase subunit B
MDDHTILPETLAAIIKMVDSGEINRGAGKKILIAVVENDVDPVAYCEEQGFNKKFDEAAIESVIDNVLINNEKAVTEFKNGKEKALQALFGACMKELKGVGDPAVIRTILQKKLS